MEKSDIVAVMIAHHNEGKLEFEFLFKPDTLEPTLIINALFQFLTLMKEGKIGH